MKNSKDETSQLKCDKECVGSPEVLQNPVGLLHRSKTRLVRKSSYKSTSTGFLSVIRTITVEFNLPNEQTITINCVGNHTVRQIKCLLLYKVRELYSLFERLEEHELILTYTMKEKTYEICDMLQTFQTLQVVKKWTNSNQKASLDVKYASPETIEEKENNMKLSELMGIGWGNHTMLTKYNPVLDDDEVYLTRRKLTNVRRRAIETRCSLDYAMEAVIDEFTIPQHVAANIDGKNRINVCIYGPSKSSTIMSVNMEAKPCEIIQEFFQGLTPARKVAFGIPENTNSSEYVLKVSGMIDYIIGQHRIIDFVYVRLCIARKTDPNLSLCKPISEAGDKCGVIDDFWYLVDDSTGSTENHLELTLIDCKKNHTEIVVFSLWDMTKRFRIKILGVDYMTVNEDVVGLPDEVYIQMTLYRGTQQLAPSISSKPVLFQQDFRWYKWFEFDIELRNLPKEARLNANIIGVFRNRSVRVKTGLKTEGANGEQHVILRWSNMQLLNHRSVLRTGQITCKTWPMLYNEDVSFETHTGTTAPNQESHTKKPAELCIEFDSYMHPVVFPNGGWKSTQETEINSGPAHGSPDWKMLEEILQSDALTTLTDEHKQLLRKYSCYCKNRGNSLPKVLQSVDAANLESVVHMHALLKDWTSISIEVALELLDSLYVDEKVRNLAVDKLKSLSNNKLSAYLLQLTQALKFEPYHDSALARFLLERALQSKRIGHFFFWFLRSEIENPHVCQRYSILLEAYLRGCGTNMIHELFKQIKVVNSMKILSNSMSNKIGKSGSSGSKVVELLREELRNINFPEKFRAHFDPRISLGKLVVDKCKIMDSKKKPLWLEFENGDENSVSDSTRIIRIIFKQGDDLRQDMLTLQMLSLMGQLWHEEGLDLHLLPYGCISTGLQMGIIQVVPNATTVARIQKESGGLIRGTFRDEVLKKWLERKNTKSESMDGVIDTFMLSCAGYCVATYILGIGDRHNDNIMVTERGNLFHIDFGHFLGNTKRFYGIQRERVPFVLTPDFVYVMGTENSERFQNFKDVSIHAYLVIRRNAPLFINLFHMMKSTGIPELSSVRDIQYLQNVLVLDKTEHEARSHFLAEIAGVLRKSWTVQVNWLMHILVHSGSSS
ncbi:unnamed protein product [Clavelina lepadiformis]|uniref:Phosphatidylinositol-4,5-bisphosphate 3-kinase n=1 Tax=Clavelina lepadiformis TaxID=159417 RepID=A0ABP0G306_CLALP